MTRTLAEIDALLASPKSFYGRPEWVEDNGRARMASAIVDIQNALIPNLQLHATASIETRAQTGSIVLVLDGRPLQRLSFRPGHAHTNPPRHPTPPALRALTLPPGRTRLHGWGDNRIWPRADNVATASLIEPEPDTMAVAFGLFLEASGITAYIPPAPWRPKLELL